MLSILAILAVVIGGSVLLGMITWGICHPREIRIAVRRWRNTRAERKAESITREWNPRSTAMRGEFARMDRSKLFVRPQPARSVSASRPLLRVVVRADSMRSDSSIGG